MARIIKEEEKEKMTRCYFLHRIGYFNRDFQGEENKQYLLCPSCGMKVWKRDITLRFLK
jgi:methionine synthase II (cobalamin-independent)